MEQGYEKIASSHASNLVPREDPKSRPSNSGFEGDLLFRSAEGSGNQRDRNATAKMASQAADGTVALKALEPPINVDASTEQFIQYYGPTFPIWP